LELFLSFSFIKTNNFVPDIVKMPTTTQLARVADRSPLLVALVPRTDAEGATSRSFLAVKVRSTLVHFLVDGRVWVGLHLTSETISRKFNQQSVIALTVLSV
jgi:hypothetical protein